MRYEVERLEPGQTLSYTLTIPQAEPARPLREPGDGCLLARRPRARQHRDQGQQRQRRRPGPDLPARRPQPQRGVGEDRDRAPAAGPGGPRGGRQPRSHLRLGAGAALRRGPRRAAVLRSRGERDRAGDVASRPGRPRRRARVRRSATPRARCARRCSRARSPRPATAPRRAGRAVRPAYRTPTRRSPPPHAPG
ncbi:hypothetical protein G5V59_16845 [Nocardioides sp. W3-2-3]|uniref:hypothetical protein n=1 Tax=Nocardioides convexus TaxID=2712224 RepID=UPI002418919E|nr:hypothetical protein [Nocardioides convexus]NHA00992.1 hypothetical protein [Nocardioides convexus]